MIPISILLQVYDPKTDLLAGNLELSSSVDLINRRVRKVTSHHFPWIIYSAVQMNVMQSCVSHFLTQATFDNVIWTTEYISTFQQKITTLRSSWSAPPTCWRAGRRSTCGRWRSTRPSSRPPGWSCPSCSRYDYTQQGKLMTKRLFEFWLPALLTLNIRFTMLTQPLL